MGTPVLNRKLRSLSAAAVYFEGSRRTSKLLPRQMTLEAGGVMAAGTPAEAGMGLIRQTIWRPAMRFRSVSAGSASRGIRSNHSWNVDPDVQEGIENHGRSHPLDRNCVGPDQGLGPGRPPKALGYFPPDVAKNRLQLPSFWPTVWEAAHFLAPMGIWDNMLTYLPPPGLSRGPRVHRAWTTTKR